jgi:hypothetical protein
LQALHHLSIMTRMEMGDCRVAILALRRQLLVLALVHQKQM